MQLNSLIQHKKKLQRMLNVCKQKQMACKLYLKEEPEHVSRNMLRYLASLEENVDDSFINSQQISIALGSMVLMILLLTIFPGQIAIFYFFALFLFLASVFLLPYLASRRHIKKTKEFISNKELPKLRKQINSLRNQIKNLTQQIEAERARQTRQSSSQYNVPRRKTQFGKREALSILGLSQGASFDEIKRAYRKKVMQYHPDKSSNLSEEKQLFYQQETIKLNKAYAYLKNRA